jgi:A/G-specific adenine glycosylase
MNFQKIVYTHYAKNKRNYPWRTTTDPYKILVSELMLQQTQTDRVVPKYLVFIKTFPTIKKLANATTADVIRHWQGLGYNRRALYLKKCAANVVTEYKGIFPKKETDLQKLPGIGPYTAAAIMAFAYNKPAIVIETNIRTAYIFHFFTDATDVSDSELIPIIKKTLDKKNPRVWYNALMDYGAAVKREHGNLSRKSKQYTKQSTFKGSEREVRGKILRMASLGCNIKEAVAIDPRAEKVIADLETEGFIVKNKTSIMLKD